MKNRGNNLIIIAVFLLIALVLIYAFFFYEKPPDKPKVRYEERVFQEASTIQYEIKLKDGSTHSIPLSSLISNINIAQLERDAALHIPDIHLEKYFTLSVDPILDLIGPFEKCRSAKLHFNEGTLLYEIEEEREGNELIPDFEEKLLARLYDYKNKDVIDLVGLGYYCTPARTKDDNILNEELRALNKYHDFLLEYDVLDQQEILTFADIRPWLTVNKNKLGRISIRHPYKVSKEAISEYVQSLDEKYTTVGKPRIFHTSTGKDLELSRSKKEWELDTETLEKDLYDRLWKNQSAKQDLPFLRTGTTLGVETFQGSYIEISIEDQRLWMYQDNKCVLNTQVVTGNTSAGHGTRKGLFYLDMKTTNTMLRGEGYEVHVNYWMPFDGGIGLHDASWRSKFGGKIYKTNGSHGCVNMPNEAAKFIYNNITFSTPIIVY